MSINIGTFWFIVAIIFGVGELMTTSLTLIWFSIGALVSMILSPFIESVLIQAIIFAIISIVLLVIATKYLVDRDKNVKYNTNLQGIISQKGIVVQDIEPYEVGIVKLNGEEWSAISKDKVKIEKGKIVEVIQIEGVKLIVREVSNINLDLDNNKDDTDSISREIDIKIKTSE
ncbi:NfeD family protein [Intestinibacter sp.]|uniref:NfeD family protein n=1 Tax=Intestinibacter sp. TaxID=1965304 RepID=UPI002A91BB22|nr:NfeD family protein [Intestinibacter sp.]MDY5213217.1 NfeD family protein [Intestinibacter sp.]